MRWMIWRFSGRFVRSKKGKRLARGNRLRQDTNSQHLISPLNLLLSATLEFIFVIQFVVNVEWKAKFRWRLKSNNLNKLTVDHLALHSIYVDAADVFANELSEYHHMTWNSTKTISEQHGLHSLDVILQEHSNRTYCKWIVGV